jgi:hypothetical protein
VAGTRGGLDGGGEAVPESPIIFKGYVDPLDNMKVELLNQVLAKHKLFFVVAPVSGDISSVDKLDVDAIGAGIFYRPFETYQVAIGSMDARVGMSEEYLISLPSATSAHLAKIPMANFVANKFNMTFANGVPQTVSIDKPSSAMAAASMPFQIIQAIVSLPSQLFQFRINLQRESAINTENYADALLNQKLAEKKLSTLEKKIAQGRPLGGGGNAMMPNMGAQPTMPTTAQPVVQPYTPAPPATTLPASNFTPATNFVPVLSDASDLAGNEETPPTNNFNP